MTERAGITGTVALVTGAGRGIGAAVASKLESYDAIVAAADLRGAKYELDVTDGAAVEELVASVEADLGPIGLLVNVAGVLRGGPVIEYSDDDWDAVFAVNTKAVFRVSRAVVRRMVPRSAGVVVTVASNSAGVPRAGLAAYGASKAASASFTRTLGLEVARHGIRCNVVAPGSTDTAMLRELDPVALAGVIEGSPGVFRNGIPLGRLADTADVADAVAFLASDEARHITMHDLYVDGGQALRA